MSQAPTVLTQPELTQRSAQPVCLIQPDEVLRVRTPAYSKSNADISFLVRQPSASAILCNHPELQLELEFTTADNTMCKDDFKTGKDATPANRYTVASDQQSDNVRWPQMYPLQQKCIRNVVLSINGASQTFRSNEIGVEYGLLHGSRKFFEKSIGAGINEYTKQYVKGVGINAQIASNGQTMQAENETEARQRQMWQNAMMAYS